jgi:hypothetical protein
MQLKWIKCQGEVWCKLISVNLAHSHFDNLEGVYIIWHGGQKAATVRIGKGNIRDRLAQHRTDTDIQAFDSLGLFVTWASVNPQFRDGVEVFLANKLRPKVGDRFPNVAPIEVNLPW